MLELPFDGACYDTAWHLLHRLRKAMVNDDRTRLTGLIEADETHIGGRAKGKSGRGVAAAGHKQVNVEPASQIRTDGWRGYSATALAGYKHTVRIVGTPGARTRRRRISTESSAI